MREAIAVCRHVLRHRKYVLHGKKEEERQIKGQGVWGEGRGKRADMGACRKIVDGPRFCLEFSNVHVMACVFNTSAQVQQGELS